MHFELRLLSSSALMMAVFTPPAFAAEGAGEPAQARDPASPPSTLSANVTFASQYVGRGIGQSWGRPALQGGVDYVRPDGWSAGAWGSTVDERFVENGSRELDLYGGYTGTAGALGYNVSAIYYLYPGARIAATHTRFDYGELSAGLTWKSFYVKYNVTVTPTFFGITQARGSGYLDAGVNHELGHGVTLNLHAGDGRVAGSGNAAWNWRDVRAGFTAQLDERWSAAVAWSRAYGATPAYEHYSTGVPDRNGMPAVADVSRRAVVLTVTRTF